MRVHSKSAQVHSKSALKAQGLPLLHMSATKNGRRRVASASRHPARALPSRLGVLAALAFRRQERRYHRGLCDLAPPVRLRWRRIPAFANGLPCLRLPTRFQTCLRFARLLLRLLLRLLVSASRNHPRSLVESTCEAKRRHVSSELDQEAIASAIKSCGRPQ